MARVARSSVVRVPDVAAYERIRSLVIGQMAKSGDAPMRLSSYRELAEAFGVTPPTVLKALKDLVADGFLVVRPGVGTFTNPARLGGSAATRIVGCFAGDGRNVFLDRPFWRLLPPFADALLERDGDLRLQHGFLPGGELDGIGSMGLDAVLWFAPSAAIRPRLQELRSRHGLPVLAVMGRCPGVSSFWFDDEVDNERIASRMLAEGRRRILLLAPSEPDPAAERGVERAFAAHGLAFDSRWVIRDSPDERALFARTVQTLRPDGIICNCQITPYWPALKGSLELATNCRVYTGIYPLHRGLGYVGWAGEPDLAADAPLAAANMAAQFSDPPGAEVLDHRFSTVLTLRDDRPQA